MAFVAKYTLLIIPTLCFAGQAAVCFWYGERAQAMILIGYTIANIGLLLSMIP